MIEEIEEHTRESTFIFEHPDTSRVIEKVLQISSGPVPIHRIFSLLLPNICHLVQCKCASHIVQCVLSLIPKILIEEHSSSSPNASDESMSHLLSQLIDKLTDFGLSTLFLDERSTFVVRDLLWVTSGVVRFDTASKHGRMSLHNVRKIPSFQDFGKHVASFKGFADSVAHSVLDSDYKLSSHIQCDDENRDHHMTNRILCGSLGVLVQCLFITKSADILQRLIDEILTPPPPPSKQGKRSKKTATAEERKQQHVKEAIYKSSHLMQCIFECGKRTVAAYAVKKCLNAKDFRKMAMDKEANFVLQSILRVLFDVNSIVYIGSAIQHVIVELFEMNRIGVLVQILDAFGRAKLKPSKMVFAIIERIESDSKYGDKKLVQRFLSLNASKEALRSKFVLSTVRPLTSRHSVLGCLLLSAILKSNSLSLQRVCRCIVHEVECEDLVKMAKDSSGSMVIQSFIESAYILDAMKWDLVDKIKRKLPLLSTDKFGAYVIEAMFYALPMEHKTELARKLLEKGAVLMGSRTGVMVHRKMKLELLQRDEAEWTQFISGQRKHQKHRVAQRALTGNSGSKQPEHDGRASHSGRKEMNKRLTKYVLSSTATPSAPKPRVQRHVNLHRRHVASRARFKPKVKGRKKGKKLF